MHSLPEGLLSGATPACSLESHLHKCFLAGAQIYEIALHSSFVFCYYCTYRSNNIHRLRVAGSWQPGLWFTNPDVFCKQHRHQQRAKRDAHVADHERFIGNDYC